MIQRLMHEEHQLVVSELAPGCVRSCTVQVRLLCETLREAWKELQ